MRHPRGDGCSTYRQSQTGLATRDVFEQSLAFSDAPSRHLLVHLLAELSHLALLTVEVSLQVESICAPAFLVSVMPSGNFTFSAANNLFYQHDALPRYLLREIRIGQAPSDRFRNSLNATFQRCLASRAQVCFETALDRNGYEAMIRITIMPIISGGGTIEALLGILSDVTQDRQWEQELLIANLQLAHALSALKGMAWLFDTKRQTFSCTSTKTALNGDTEISNLSYSDWLKLVHPDDREGYSATFKMLCSESSSAQSLEFRIVLDGFSHWLRCYRTAIPDLGGNAVILGVAINVTSEIENREHLTDVASRDSLTGILNRAGFLQQLQAMLERSEQDGQSVTVFMIDLDDFKPVNDNLGHAAGDTLLQEVGQRILEGTRGGDVCGRLGGDEFAVAARGLAPTAVDAMTRSLRLRVMTPVCYQEHTLSVGVSIGVATARPGTDGLALIKRADDDLYVDKRQKIARRSRATG